MCKVKLAATYGFCKGAECSLESLNKILEEYPNEKIYTIGELVHNKSVIDEYKRRGVEVITSPDDHEKGVALIRAHGITPDAERLFKERGFTIVDATCKIVKRNHELIAKSNKNVLYFGKKNHPETISTVSRVKTVAIVLSSLDDLNLVDPKVKYDALVQTTFSSLLFESMKEELSKRGVSVNYLSKICASSIRRRSAIRELCTECDTIVIVGDKHSANSLELYNIAVSEGRRAYLVSGPEDLNDEIYESERVGLSAGASTPMDVIKRVRKCILSNGKVK